MTGPLVEGTKQDPFLAHKKSLQPWVKGDGLLGRRQQRDVSWLSNFLPKSACFRRLFIWNKYRCCA